MMPKQNARNSLLKTRPAAVQPGEDPVGVDWESPPGAYPFVIQSKSEYVVITQWVAQNQALIRKKLLETGAILFRGFNVHSVDSFQQVIGSFGGNPIEYTQRSSPRTAVLNNIYTSTDHPADQVINMHNELSYAPNWPLRIVFCCVQPAAAGGETPVTDSRAVLNSLRPATRERFLARGVRYVRNLGGGLGLAWQEVFGTDDRQQVEKECAANGMDFCWQGADRLRVEWTKPAILTHPATGEAVWFNHAYFFNAHTLDASVHQSLAYGEGLPFNTYYGDGSPIEPDVIGEVGEAYEKAKKVFAWQKGDVLLLDNMLMAHGRNAYEGQRKVFVAMWDPYF
jgi:alpha-ketoglutarate-dependent taurine dioxygenase